MVLHFKSVKAVASVSAGLPANPVDGQLHWDTSGSGSLKIYLSALLIGLDSCLISVI